MSDLRDIALRRVGDRLEPVDDLAAEQLRNVPAGKTLLVSVRTPRNGRQHRLLWAMLKIVTDNAGRWPSPEALLDAIKIETGHVEIRCTVDGEPFAIPKSISYAAMPQTEFNDWFKKAIAVVCRDVIPSMSEEALQAEILAMVGEPLRAVA